MLKLTKKSVGAALALRPFALVRAALALRLSLVGAALALRPSLVGAALALRLSRCKQRSYN